MHSGKSIEQGSAYRRRNVRSLVSTAVLLLPLFDCEQASELFGQDSLKDLLNQAQVNNKRPLSLVLLCRRLQFSKFGNTKIAKLLLPTIKCPLSRNHRATYLFNRKT